ncbi:MAG: hypothetical protein CL944_02385 [Candidatus Diapherotrites archaeon]|uniref:Uncharacterized protein n=1 Tax=Candidatus Iainarchaeum sp. TaxID=3101447 RepID=A0A2D6LQ27_9ARCH|nr:hypothetical protein [Candidatus Diapherotrites archaeon]|tara:strand:+ start:8212 stop:8805 length:594 start_codon:yes stop_codon:yes gene_type:complete
MAKRLKNKGFKASTIEGQKGFTPYFAKRPKSGAQRNFLKGMHQAIEAWMIDHPGQRFPTKEFSEKFNVKQTSIIPIAEKIEKHHKLPERKRGGPNFILPKEVNEVIGGIYKKAQNGDAINVLDVIREIARKTKLVVSANAISVELKKLELEHKKGISVLLKGLKGKRKLDLNDLTSLLKKEGIKAKRFRPKPIRSRD